MTNDNGIMGVVVPTQSAGDPFHDRSPAAIASRIHALGATEGCPCGSGNIFRECHGALPLPPPPVLAPPDKKVRLDLGCGQNPAPGFEGVDLNAPGAKHKVDLFKFPWPWADESVDELHASHFVEHIPARDVDLDDIAFPSGGKVIENNFVGQDMLFAFFDECYRILKPGGTMKVVVPALQSVRAFQDPTHRRFIPAELFMYLNADWRKSAGLDHYRVRCHFAGNINHTCATEMNLLHPEAATRRFKEGWNTIVDFHVDLTKK